MYAIRSYYGGHRQEVRNDQGDLALHVSFGQGQIDHRCDPAAWRNDDVALLEIGFQVQPVADVGVLLARQCDQGFGEHALVHIPIGRHGEVIQGEVDATSYNFV